jgi:hypothetical protein
MNAETIATALGGRQIGGSWSARCLAHEDRTPSLSIRDADHGKVLVRCHAGCDQGRVLAALRSRGLWPNDGYRPVSPKVRERRPSRTRQIQTTPAEPRRHLPSGDPPSVRRGPLSKSISLRAASTCRPRTGCAFIRVWGIPRVASGPQ